jgi:hypothetical protein
MTTKYDTKCQSLETELGFRPKCDNGLRASLETLMAPYASPQEAELAMRAAVRGSGVVAARDFLRRLAAVTDEYEDGRA